MCSGVGCEVDASPGILSPGLASRTLHTLPAMRCELQSKPSPCSKRFSVVAVHATTSLVGHAQDPPSDNSTMDSCVPIARCA